MRAPVETDLVPGSLLKLELPSSALMESESVGWIQGPKIGICNKFPAILMYSRGRETGEEPAGPHVL